MKKFICTLLLIGLFSTSVQATHLEKLVELQQKGDIASLTQIAQTGDYKSQVLLIEYYNSKRDMEKQFYWIKEFAKQGNDYAQTALGAMYLYGIGVDEYDAKRAIELFELADKKNNAKAQYNLGMIYLNGMGVEKDETLAEQWFKKACKNEKQYC